MTPGGQGRDDESWPRYVSYFLTAYYVYVVPPFAGARDDAAGEADAAFARLASQIRALAREDR